MWVVLMFFHGQKKTKSLLKKKNETFETWAGLTSVWWHHRRSTQCCQTYKNGFYSHSGCGSRWETPQIIRPQHICTKSKNTKLELLAFFFFFVRIGGQNKGLGLKLHPFNIYPVIWQTKKGINKMTFSFSTESLLGQHYTKNGGGKKNTQSKISITFIVKDKKSMFFRSRHDQHGCYNFPRDNETCAFNFVVWKLRGVLQELSVRKQVLFS